MKPYQKEKALDLYMAGQSQKHISTTLGISEKTLYTWIKQNEWQQLRKAALTAPAVIVNNMYSQLIELQTTIAGREEGKRYPDASEAEITRKLVNSIIKLKDHPSLGTSIQVLMSFSTFLQQLDPEFGKQMVTYADAFIKSKAKNGYKPYQVEYEENEHPHEETELEEKQPKEEIPIAKEASHLVLNQEEISGSEISAIPEISKPIQPEAIDNTILSPQNPAIAPSQKAVKTGNATQPIKSYPPGTNLANALRKLRGGL